MNQEIRNSGKESQKGLAHRSKEKALRVEAFDLRLSFQPSGFIILSACPQLLSPNSQLPFIPYPLKPSAQAFVAGSIFTRSGQPRV